MLDVLVVNAASTIMLLMAIGACILDRAATMPALQKDIAA